MEVMDKKNYDRAFGPKSRIAWAGVVARNS